VGAWFLNARASSGVAAYRHMDGCGWIRMEGTLRDEAASAVASSFKSSSSMFLLYLQMID
jgi:hypothetical protein